jgi:hypothetical protein
MTEMLTFQLIRFEPDERDDEEHVSKFSEVDDDDITLLEDHGCRR